jgi:signal peptidase I
MTFSIETKFPFREKPKKTKLKPGDVVEMEDPWKSKFTIVDDYHIRNGDGTKWDNGTTWPGSYVNKNNTFFSPVKRNLLEIALCAKKRLIYTPSTETFQAKKEGVIFDPKNP